MANKSTLRFVREKGKGGPWTIGFIHPGEPIINFCTHTRRKSEFKFMPGRFGIEGCFRKFCELKEKGMMQKQ